MPAHTRTAHTFRNNQPNNGSFPHHTRKQIQWFVIPNIDILNNMNDYVVVVLFLLNLVTYTGKHVLTVILMQIE